MSPSRLGSRTVHESRPLTRLLSDLAFVRRTATARVIRRLPIVTMAVEELEGVIPMRPTGASGEDVIGFHPIAFREEQAARRTFAGLSLPKLCDSRRELLIVCQART